MCFSLCFFLCHGGGLCIVIEGLFSVPSFIINRIRHWSLLQTEKSKPEGKRIMPETMFTEFPELSVDPRVGISRPVFDYFSYL